MRARVVVLCLILILAVFAGIVSAQSSQASASQGTKRDLAGVWYPSSQSTFQFEWTDSRGVPITELPMTAWAQERFKINRPIGPHTAINSNDPDFSCFPSGVPKAYLYSYPVELIPTPGRMIMFFEYGHNVRQIFTDGRSHPRDANPTWMGDSVGRWEADTLVVDSVGFNDKTWLDYNGHPHSDQMHVVERIRRPDHDTLRIDLTIDDPKAYAIPLHTTRKLILKPNWNIMESVCEENSTNFLDYEKRVGRQQE